ncbi:MAG: DUF4386 domain-containing protein [Anaerolineae bacterium]
MNKERQNPGTFRSNATAAGVLFLVTHVGSIGGAALYGLALYGNGYAWGAAADALVLVGALLEVITAMAVVGTAVALYPAARRQREALALGYVGLRTLEAGVIALGVIPLLLWATLNQIALNAGGDSAGFVSLSNLLVEVHRLTNLVGPGLVCGINTVVIAWVLYQSRLVPRFIPALGLVGGTLVFVLTVFMLFGEVPAWSGLLVLPIFTWELLLALWLIFVGFNRKTVVTAPAVLEPAELAMAA